MAQYYQVLNQEEKINNESSIARFYSNDQNERRTVQYVIAPEGTQPFQTQQVVVSSDQLMVLEDQQQQVILDQSQVTYRTSSLIIRDTSGLEFQNNHRQVYYMANRPHQSNQSVVVEPAIPSQAPPLVLNHQLRQNQIGKVNIPVTGGVNSAQVPPLSVGQQSHLQEMKAPVRPNVPAIRAPMNVQYQKAGEPELVGLPDGTFITMAEYQKLVAQQKTLAQPPNIPDSSRVIPTKPTPARKRNPPNRSAGPAKPRNRSKNTKSARGAKNAVPSSPEDEAASAPIHSRVSKPKNNTDDLPMHVNREYQRRQAEALLRQQVQSQPQPQLQAQLQPHPQSQFQSQPQFQTQPQPQTQQQPQTQPQHQTQPQPQTQLQPQTLSQNRNQFIIRPPRPRTDRSQPYRGLPAFLDPSQIQHILDNTPLTEEYSDSIRMLVLLENGEQRLITFTLPKEACDIHEILEQVNVPFQCDTKIDVQETDAPGLNYIVTVGNMPHCVLYQPEDVNPPVQNVYQEVVADILEPPKPPSPEIPKDVPQKLIPGKFALCSHCGYLSEDFNKCTRCKRILPEDVKAISPVNGQGKKIDLRQLADKKFLPTPAKLNGTPKLNLLQKKKPAKGKLLECETVVVSSDDEDDVAKKQPIKNINEQLFEKLGASITISPISKEPSIIDIQKNSMLSTSKHVEKIASSDVIGTVILCRTVRIGSYRFVPPEPIRIDSNGLLLKVPHPSVPNAIKTIKIERHEIIKVLISFQKSLPVLFYYLLPSVGTNIRTILDMVPGSSLYFDPLTDLEESHKRITVLPELISEESKLTLQRIYTAPGYSVLDELTYKEANDILIKTCPKEITRTALGFSNMSEIKTLLTYPPEGRGRISINTEDYICLGQDQFLNDVIIDFYLKYLVLNMPKEKQEKVHIFSTFFYKRLTTKPIKASRKSQPSEVDPNLNAAQKRHARVKTWTKTVNLFEKDFIIIPINENSHWFLAIVCFPGMNGTHTMDGQSIKIEPRPSKKKKITVPVSIGSVTVTAVKEKVNVAISCEDPELSDKDEAEGDESELDSDSSEDAPPSISMDNRPPIKQPCILIFDSLAGASRSRVVATIRDYLTCEYKAKMNADKVYTKDVIKGACPKVPQQTNFTDCGLYLLQYVEEFFTDPIKDYYIPINSLKTWFQEITVTKKREDISNLIKCLMEETGKNLADLPEVLFPTLNGELIDESMDHEDKFADIDEDEPMDDDDEEYIPPVKTKKVKPAALPAAESDSENSRDSPVKNSVSDNGTPKNAESAAERAIVNAEVPKPDISEFPKATTDKDTLSYLKAKRIIRHKNVKSEGPDSKKFRSSE